MIFDCRRAITELLSVLCGVRHTSKDVFSIRHVLHICAHDITGGHVSISGILFEAFHSTKVDDEFDHVQTLK